MFDAADPGPDYELAWPRAIFESEARVITSGPYEVQAEVELLLEEAFTNDVPKHDYRRSGGAIDLGVGPDPYPQPSLLRQILAAVHRLPTQAAPAQYWGERRGAGVRSPAAIPGRTRQLHTDWANMVNRLQSNGYFYRLAPQACVDDRGPTVNPNNIINAEISGRIGLTDAWPPHPRSADWTEDEFWDLVEVVHDLISRPRGRTWHDYQQCGWHYENFAATPARRLYRDRVNSLLARHDIALRLADEGEDLGRLVRTPGDDRAELLGEAVAAAPTTERASVNHAIALFRARGAGPENKRSACIALAGLLEERRTLIKTEMLSRDEGALFHIANGFAVRHRKADQRRDYDEAYLDWLFWIYLATVELTDRLIARSRTGQ